MRSFIVIWMSKVILKILPADIKSLFRLIEKNAIKLCTLKSHQAFNSTCLNNNLLPNYTNIYIYIFSGYI